MSCWMLLDQCSHRSWVFATFTERAIIRAVTIISTIPAHWFLVIFVRQTRLHHLSSSSRTGWKLPVASDWAQHNNEQAKFSCKKGKTAKKALTKQKICNFAKVAVATWWSLIPPGSSLLKPSSWQHGWCRKNLFTFCEACLCLKNWRCSICTKKYSKRIFHMV